MNSLLTIRRDPKSHDNNDANFSKYNCIYEIERITLNCLFNCKKVRSRNGSYLCSVHRQFMFLTLIAGTNGDIRNSHEGLLTTLLSTIQNALTSIVTLLMSRFVTNFTFHCIRNLSSRGWSLSIFGMGKQKRILSYARV